MSPETKQLMRTAQVHAAHERLKAALEAMTAAYDGDPRGTMRQLAFSAFLMVNGGHFRESGPKRTVRQCASKMMDAADNLQLTATAQELVDRTVAQ